MKIRFAFSVFMATVLASLLVLGACGQKKEEKAAPASSAQTSQSSQSSSSTKETKTGGTARPAGQAGQSTQQEVSPGQTQAEAAPATDQSSQSQAQSQAPAGQEASPAPAPQPAQRATIPSSNLRYKGVLALADGDFSKAAGSWDDGQGNVVTIAGNGSISVQQAGQEAKNYSVMSYAYTLDDGKYTARLAPSTPGAGSPGLQIITGADGNVSSVQLIK